MIGTTGKMQTKPNAIGFGQPENSHRTAGIPWQTMHSVSGKCESVILPLLQGAKMSIDFAQNSPPAESYG